MCACAASRARILRGRNPGRPGESPSAPTADGRSCTAESTRGLLIGGDYRRRGLSRSVAEPLREADDRALRARVDGYVGHQELQEAQPTAALGQQVVVVDHRRIDERPAVRDV